MRELKWESFREMFDLGVPRDGHVTWKREDSNFTEFELRCKEREMEVYGYGYYDGDYPVAFLRVYYHVTTSGYMVVKGYGVYLGKYIHPKYCPQQIRLWIQTRINELPGWDGRMDG